MQLTVTDPTNPFTEVSVNGTDTVPLEGMVTLPAEIVKMGVEVGTPARQRVGANAERTTKYDSTLFLVITETSSAQVERNARESYPHSTGYLVLVRRTGVEHAWVTPIVDLQATKLRMAKLWTQDKRTATAQPSASYQR
jgi:hypothetical protein